MATWNFYLPYQSGRTSDGDCSADSGEGDENCSANSEDATEAAVRIVKRVTEAAMERVIERTIRVVRKRKYA